MHFNLFIANFTQIEGDYVYAIKRISITTGFIAEWGCGI